MITSPVYGFTAAKEVAEEEDKNIQVEWSVEEMLAFVGESVQKMINHLRQSCIIEQCDIHRQSWEREYGIL